ncbi:TPA: Arc family DNA-binding protein [Pseudomonas aeruginosa]|uniref:Arc family DNA-binding protein n=1 Tax=Pseudomonas aeruginosa TaxID=287 RepID=UPI000F527AD8|nr:Arc family DNA-binding protein [Pseudomonas aeruginosa]MCQ9718375.1 Arc family DNA-binding protein [Pseudomonas aeruginosa]MCQ9752438.1 Arc family DNA-binding protein [Pseudomonas aeruginosa]MCQ9759647.1 Arc family DNA-binding protein [Pseudomonas aeruginosa]MCQ9777214.1 Arc family DNA-binding protein [Pseudomonas aeruginosa]MCQ9793922.1 Arc family DNA-binding protein [Pseudomonas aeruginosa]
MSREDPQFKLRMPQELRQQAEQAAKAAGRSLNAELVTRIESSFLSSSTPEVLIPAKRAKELALMARTAIPNEIRKRAISAIQKAVSLGHTEAYANLSDLSLEVGISDEDLESLIKPILNELKKAGYSASLEDITTLAIEF